MDREKIKHAIYHAQKAQRNYDHSKTIPEDDFNLLIYAATTCPSKQNEAHYRLHIITDQKKIEEIYFHTKNFSLFKDEKDIKEQFSDAGGVWKFDRDKCVRNSQVKANILFAYEDYTGQARGGDHILAKNNPESVTVKAYTRSKDTSIGISVGELVLTANLLGYRTGISSGFDSNAVRGLLKSENSIKLLVGVGYENKNINRRIHPDVLNSEVGEYFRTGNLDENWKFPSFYKKIPIILNGKDYLASESIDLIYKNKSLIVYKSIDHLKAHFPKRTDDHEKCIRDIEFVIDAYTSDLFYEKNDSTIEIASAYWREGTRQIASYEAELSVHNFLVDYICENIINNQKDKSHLNYLKNMLLDIIVNGTQNS